VSADYDEDDPEQIFTTEDTEGTEFRQRGVSEDADEKML
jgi:hypothetical protein